jgi:hypothetical protein
LLPKLNNETADKSKGGKTMRKVAILAGGVILSGPAMDAASRSTVVKY